MFPVAKATLPYTLLMLLMGGGGKQSGSYTAGNYGGAQEDRLCIEKCGTVSQIYPPSTLQPSNPISKKSNPKIQWQKCKAM